MTIRGRGCRRLPSCVRRPIWFSENVTHKHITQAVIAGGRGSNSNTRNTE